MPLVQTDSNQATDTDTELDHADSTALLQRQTRILELIAFGTRLPDVLDGVVWALEELIPGCVCSILLLDRAHGTLHHGAAPSRPEQDTAAIDGIRTGENAGSCGAAAHLGRPVVAVDIRVDPRWVTFRELALPHGLRACWSSPIRGRGGTVGTFAVYHRAPHRPDAREQRLVERFSHLASVAIDHAGLYGELAESEERFRRAFEDNAVGMALTDLGGRLVKVNRALVACFGWPEKDLLGVELGDLLPPVPGQPEPVVGGLGSVAYEAQGVRSDGRILRLGVVASALQGPDGASARLSVNVVDLTQRDAAEREARGRREAEVARTAAEAASLAKSDFVSALSHEIRTPLQAITGFTELLGSLDLTPERQHAALGHIETATGHILSLVEDSLDIAAIEAGALTLHRARVDLDALVGDVLALLQPVADAHGVSLACAPVAQDVVADARRLRQVLINLVTNGVRHNHRGGHVEVTIRRTDTGVAVLVSDSGPGIPPEQLHRLFIPFDRLDAEGAGSGLGMTLARNLTEAMGGGMHVRSVVGSGTTVTVELPVR